MINILDFGLKELQKEFTKNEFLGYKAKQVFEWIYKKAVFDFVKMTSISFADAKKLQEVFEPILLDYKKKTGISTVKFLINTHDGFVIECVVIPSNKGNTLCVSTQIGCALKCDFCETGKGGFKRDLTSAEIILQYLVARQEGYDVERVVYMGMGEPLLNLDNVLKATNILNDENGANIGMRRFTLSTAGIIPGIKKMIEKGVKLNLAVSLHAANNALRTKLMPISEKYKLRELLAVLVEYREATSRRITLEYVLLQGVNDTDMDIEQLVSLVKGTDFHINLIPYNPTSSGYKVSNNMDRFLEKLEKAKVNVTKRRSEGGDINAACGMLSGKK
ncbi:MAG: 23S rRNA (adenine(2503)-C(2))-methyltransferase RlmN [Candidatus Margulisbacteria bacterium]|nr:23S rRNA (adenine(2503)-C(2))-methyltransferase RlmN [Candidatus Margulisiibacteriota bacterium]